MSNFIDQEINGYKVQKAIGEGKFSNVFRALNPDGIIVALKKIKIFDMMDPKQRDKCLKEVKLMQPLDHPNIIKYLDSFIHNNELIIATEWAEKGDLKKLIKNAQSDDNPFEEISIWGYMYQIASALNHMHEKRIMHRDLKPANIFIATDGTLKVGDLGLGRVFSSETIEAYSKVGTPLYMSPELLQGEGYDMKSDVWSLGCIMYEMCEFKSPFKQNEKMSLMDLYNNITKGEFKPIGNRYSQSIRDIIQQMIVVDPQKRLDAGTVQIKSLQNFQTLENQRQSSPQIYNILIMEDIYEKLQLVQYHQYFCIPLRKQPVPKFYFALESNNREKFYYFVELCYWLMGLPKQKKNKVATPIKLGQNIEEVSKKLIADIKQWGIKLPDQLSWTQIVSGYGDVVCFILNDLLNRELIRINFKFNPPQFGQNIENSHIEIDQDQQDAPEVEDELDDSKDSVEQDILTQSIIFYRKKFNVNNLNKQLLFILKKQDQPDFNTFPVEKQVIESAATPDEWKREFNRVEIELTKFEQNLKINKNLQDYQKTAIQIKKIAQVFDQGSEYLRSQDVQDIQERWIEDLNNIPRLEERVTEFIPQETRELLISQRQQISDLQIQCEVLSKDVNIKKENYQRVENKISDIKPHVYEDNRPVIKQLIQQMKELPPKFNFKGQRIQERNYTQGPTLTREQRESLYRLDDEVKPQTREVRMKNAFYMGAYVTWFAVVIGFIMYRLGGDELGDMERQAKERIRLREQLKKERNPQ